MKPLETVYCLRFVFGILAALVCLGYVVGTNGVPSSLHTPFTFTGLAGSHSFEVPSTDANGHAFRQWSSGSTSTTIAVSSGGTYTAYYGIFTPSTYDVTIIAHCNVEDEDVVVTITEDGVPTGFTTPYTITGLAGFHNFTVPGIDANGHSFADWSTGEGTVTLSVSSGGTYTAIYGTSVPSTYDVTIAAYCDSESKDPNVDVAKDGGITGEFSFNVFLNSTSLAIIFYLLTYYLVKYRFKPLVQKPQKLLTTGIGVYFLSWIVFWTLFYTILAG